MSILEGRSFKGAFALVQHRVHHCICRFDMGGGGVFVSECPLINPGKAKASLLGADLYLSIQNWTTLRNRHKVHVCPSARTCNITVMGTF